MPPQLLFDDQKLAYILSYVNNAWGNKENIINKEEVAEARKELPQDVFTPQSLLKRFPFEKIQQEKNGTFTPTFDDTLTEITKPVVYQPLCPVPHQPPSLLLFPEIITSVGTLANADWRYVWTKGGFIKSNQVHWSSNGKPVAEFNGTPYYRARTKLLKDETFEELSKTNMQKPFYDTSQAHDFPFKFNSVNGKPEFLGYSLVDGYPKFRYMHGKHVITELIQMNDEKTGIRRIFTISPPAKTSLKLSSSNLASIITDKGELTKDGTLKLSEKESNEFSVFVIPTKETN